MSGTREGGLRARDKNLAKDPNFYKRIGAVGGSRKTPTGGFGQFTMCNCDIIPKVVHHKAQCAGKLGGLKSKRGRKMSV